jgi:hypothetical protein
VVIRLNLEEKKNIINAYENDTKFLLHQVILRKRKKEKERDE